MWMSRQEIKDGLLVFVGSTTPRFWSWGGLPYDWMVIAQLFGSRNDLSAVSSIAAARGLLLVEDCAQCYDGTARRLGTADVEMYSFGTIKTATCLGGGVLLVRDPALRVRIRMRQDRYPIQPTA